MLYYRYQGWYINYSLLLLLLFKDVWIITYYQYFHYMKIFLSITLLLLRERLRQKPRVPETRRGICRRGKPLVWKGPKLVCLSSIPPKIKKICTERPPILPINTEQKIFDIDEKKREEISGFSCRLPNRYIYIYKIGVWYTGSMCCLYWDRPSTDEWWQAYSLGVASCPGSAQLILQLPPKIFRIHADNVISDKTEKHENTQYNNKLTSQQIVSKRKKKNYNQSSTHPHTHTPTHTHTATRTQPHTNEYRD